MSPSCLLASEFIPLGDFPEGGFVSVSRAVSGNGSIVVGGGSRARGLSPPLTDVFRWSQSEGLVNLQANPLIDAPFTFAGGISLDGSTIVGGHRNQFLNDPLERSEAFRWTAAEGFVGLGYLNGGSGLSSGANDISADGKIIVGGSDSPNGDNEAFYWTAQIGMLGLGDLPGGDFRSTASAISADGLTVIGTGSTEAGSEPFRWRANVGMTTLGPLPDGYYGSSANALSTDGETIVGELYTTTTTGSQSQPFRWTEQTGFELLGDLPGGEEISSAHAVSANGTIVLGTSHVISGLGLDLFEHYKAFVWDAHHSMRDLQGVLINEYDLSSALAGWQLFSASDISYDGLSIVGSGINPEGNIEAWLVRLDRPLSAPEPSTFSLVIVAAVVIVLSRHRKSLP